MVGNDYCEIEALDYDETFASEMCCDSLPLIIAVLTTLSFDKNPLQF